MSTFTAPAIDWLALAPILIVAGAAVLGVIVEAFAPAKGRRTVQIVLALAALAAAAAVSGVALAGALNDGGSVVMDGALIHDPVGLFLQTALPILAFLGILVIADRTAAGEDTFAPQAAATPGSDYEELARRKGVVQTEAYPLLMFAVTGMMVFPTAGDLLTMFIALEVLSLPLYLLSGMARRRRLLSQEAALKYFLLGAFASAFFLMGVALLYGFAGSSRLADIADAITSGSVGLDPLLIAGLVLIAVGLLFKVGAVPFHSWTPDVYQGAPTPVTGFMAACTKVAAFGALLRVAYVLMPSLEWDLAPLLWTVAILTMLVGTWLGVRQTDVKRLLAYSAIAHAGFILVGVISFTPAGISGVLYYLVAYGVGTIGAFAIVSLLRERNAAGQITGEANHISQWAGFGRQSPLLAAVFALFLLSFAGIPLTSGFIGKFTVFASAVQAGFWPLAVVGILASAVAAFFYARIIVLMFFTKPNEESGVVVASRGPAMAAIVISTIVTLALGVYPSPLLELVGQAAHLIP